MREFPLCLKQINMGTIKTFLLGVGTAYAVYYITRKRPDGTSILDDLLKNPAFYLNKAKDYAVAETVRTVKEQIS
jgi:hypothetical protein